MNPCDGGSCTCMGPALPAFTPQGRNQGSDAKRSKGQRWSWVSAQALGQGWLVPACSFWMVGTRPCVCPGETPSLGLFLSQKTSPFSFQDSTAIPAAPPTVQHGGWPRLLPDADHLLLVTTRKRRSTKKVSSRKHPQNENHLQWRKTNSSPQHLLSCPPSHQQLLPIPILSCRVLWDLDLGRMWSVGPPPRPSSV